MTLCWYLTVWYITLLISVSWIHYFVLIFDSWIHDFMLISVSWIHDFMLIFDSWIHNFMLIFDSWMHNFMLIYDSWMHNFMLIFDRFIHNFMLIFGSWIHNVDMLSALLIFICWILKIFLFHQKYGLGFLIVVLHNHRCKCSPNNLYQLAILANIFVKRKTLGSIFIPKIVCLLTML